MKHRIQLGEHVRLKVTSRNHVDAELDRHFEAARPSFSPQCVCCNAETTRARDYAPFRRKLATPVCTACTDHAFQRDAVSHTQLGWIVGGGALFLAAASQRWSLALIEAVAAAWGCGIIFDRIRASRRRARLGDGHHRGLLIVEFSGGLLLETDNAVLADDLLARHPHARRSGALLPKATVVRED